MEPVPAFAALALLTAGLIGQGLEMRRIRREATASQSPGGDAGESAPPQNAFTDRRNIKWYAVIGAGIAVWYYAGGG